MGIKIFYAGKAKNPESIGELVKVLLKRATALRWRLKLVDEDLRGNFYPSWGECCSRIPTEEEKERFHIEFFPAMVSADSNGYYKIIDTPFADPVREFFRKGEYPHFAIDTHIKGITLYPHENCEPLDFVFDLKTQELCCYEPDEKYPDAIHGYPVCCCKTQFAGFKNHVLVCKTIKLAENLVDFSLIDDEALYYHSKDLSAGLRNFNEKLQAIREEVKRMNERGGSSGWVTFAGDEI